MSAIDYTRVNFKDYPDTTTPITAQNLNKMDKGIYDLDVVLTQFFTNHQSYSRNIPWYGTSSTAASTIAKTATTSDGKFSLATGAKVSIKFTYDNTASAPTLNVDSTGAKSIKAYGTTAPTSWWQAGDVVTFTYDGTNWIMGATEGQISQINSDKQDKLTNPLTRSNIVDNLNSSSATNVLSAAQGKVLNDNFNEKFSYNSLLANGSNIGIKVTDNKVYLIVASENSDSSNVKATMNIFSTVYGPGMVNVINKGGIYLNWTFDSNTKILTVYNMHSVVVALSITQL